MKRFAWLISLAACGGHAPAPVAPGAAPVQPPRLLPTIAEQTFYGSKASCAQGPFELEIPVGAAKYGEVIELSLLAPRRIALHATITAGDTELATIDDTFDASGRVGGNADNARCVADARERLAAERARRAGTQGPATTPGSRGSVTTPSPGAPAASPPPPASVAAELEVVATPTEVVTPVISVRIPPGATTVRIKWWSIQPNDLEGVRFGFSHVVWKPDVGEAAYEVWLAEQETKRIEEQKRLAAEAEMRARATAEIEFKEKRAEDERRREAQLHAKVTQQVVVKQHVETEEQRRVRIEAELRIKVELETRRKRQEADMRAREEAEEQRRLKIEAELRVSEEKRRHAEEAAAEKRRLKIEAELRAAEERKQFCASHPADRSCWGPGGLDMKLQLDARVEQRTAYCSQHHEDARCWTADERRTIAAADEARLTAALAPPSKPTGPPPSPLEETIPPKLSVNAEWRPGYWHWLDNTWVWLAGMWRVPEQDIVAEQTTTAPIAPPPLQVEAPPAAPVQAAVWVNGFWQWDGAKWLWVAGSWQLRPSATVSWRAATWKQRGTVHVLVPGAWIRRGGSR
ncbi:MAG TPA: hypothetical protein VMZ53_08270 [Kofleriaceae bacterium]|nr:hypothetical protein [Kofleriaceae bacterium]